MTITRETQHVQDLIGNAEAVIIDGVWDRSAAVAKIETVVKQINQL